MRRKLLKLVDATASGQVHEAYYVLTRPRVVPRHRMYVEDV